MRSIRVLLFTMMFVGLSWVSAGAALAATSADLDKNWAAGTINQWVERGLIEGYQDGTFRPDSEITRAEVAALINRSFELEGNQAVSFGDVNAADWFYHDVKIAVSNGYMTGYPDGSFQPNANITRQELAVIAAKLLALPTSDSFKEFSDSVSSPNWSKGSIGAVIDAKLMTGYPDGSFRPNNYATRAEVVVMLDNGFKQAGKIVTYYYNKPGVYGPAAGKQIIRGNVAVNTADVTLHNMTIDGNLRLGAGIGDGEAMIQNVTVTGITTIEGGGANSIHFEDSVLVTVVVNKTDNSIRIVLEGSSTIQKVVLQSGAKLEEAEGATGEGFSAVELSELLPANTTVELLGTFETVDVKSKSIKISIPSGTVKDFHVAENAADTQIALSKEAKIIALVLDAVTKVVGEGSIDKATVNIEGASFEQKPASTASTTSPSSSGGSGDENSGNESGGGGGSGNGTGENSENGDSNSTPVLVNGITVTGEKSVTTVVYGGTLQMAATITPSNATDQTISWSVDNGTGSATINATGLLTATGVGTVTVKAANTASGVKGTTEITITPALTSSVVFDESGTLVANTNMLTFTVTGGLLTEELDTAKWKYITSSSGDNGYYLTGSYAKVSTFEPLSEGTYSYMDFGGGTTYIQFKLTDADANAIKSLPGFGNDSRYLNENTDGLVAEDGWYPGAVGGSKEIYIYNIIEITNNSTHTIVSHHDYINEDAYSSTSSGTGPNNSGYIGVLSLATKVVLYEGSYTPNVTPTSGYMAIFDITPDVINKGIVVEESDWVEVDTSNFGK